MATDTGYPWLSTEPRANDLRGIAPAVLERLPFGVLVTLEHGDVLAANDALTRIFGREVIGGRDSCCDLLGCGEEGTALADGCITQWALEEELSLPELRVDVPGRATAVWLTASRLDAGRALLLLRPARRGDSRLRPEPDRATAPRLRIRCLGPLSIEGSNGDLGGGWTQQRPGQVLGYLLSRRHRAVPPEEMAEALWPEAGRSVLGTVRYFIHALRDHLEPHRERRQTSTFIQLRAGGYVLNRVAIQIDAEEFEGRLGHGLSAAARGERGAESNLASALNLYSGDFLADHPYADWAWAERNRLHSLASRGLQELIHIRLERGDEDSVQGLRDRLAEMEPLDDHVHRELIVADLRSRRNSAALRRYESLRRRMQRELGRKPEYEFRELTEIACNG